MKHTILTVSAAALISTGAAFAAPGHGSGSQSRAPSAKQQGQSQYRSERQVRESRDEAKGKAQRSEEQVRERREDGTAGAGKASSQQSRERAQEHKEVQARNQDGSEGNRPD